MRLRISVGAQAFVLVAVLTVGLVLVAGCGAPAVPTMGGTAHQGMQQALPVPTPEPGKLTVVNVRARPAPLEGGNGAAFMTVLNGLDKPIRLTSIAGTVAKAIELHETVNDNGVMKMEPHPEGFEIPAGGTLELKPGGKHVMLFGLTKPLAVGEQVELRIDPRHCRIL